MSATQLRYTSGILGFPECGFASDATFALNGATNVNWLAMQFVLADTKTLNEVRMFLDTKTGSPTTAGCTADLYSDSNGLPNASLEGPISANSVPASGNWMSWTFAGTSVLTAGTPYWIVFKNGTATPASNYPTYRFSSSGANQGFLNQTNTGGGGICYGWNKMSSTNAGSTWASVASGAQGMRLGFTDSTYAGFPVQTTTRPTNGTTANQAFGKQEVGVKFNVPANVTFNVRGIWFPIFKVSTPGNLVFSLYQGVTLLARCAAIPAGNVTSATGDGYVGYFSSVQSIKSTNQPFRVTFGDATAGDTNAKGYLSQTITFDSDSNSTPLLPMNGSIQKTITADNTASPVVFTDTAGDFFPFALLLDTTGEFTSAGGGGTRAYPIGGT